MDKKYIILTLFIIIVLAVIIVTFLQPKSINPNSYECTSIKGDSEGYLLKICEHIKSNDISTNIDPTEYNIINIKEYICPNQLMSFCEPGQKLIEVSLDCCEAGDIAYFDKETGKLVGFFQGYYE